MYCFRTFFQYILVCLKVGTKNATLVDHRRPFKEKRFHNESINISENLHANRLFRRHQNKNGSIFLRISLVQDEPFPLFHIDAIFYDINFLYYVADVLLMSFCLVILQLNSNIAIKHVAFCNVQTGKYSPKRNCYARRINIRDSSFSSFDYIRATCSQCCL